VSSLEAVLPFPNDYVPKPGDPAAPLGWRVFDSEEDRKRFIRSALLVLSQNGFHNISQNRVELFYSRVGNNNVAFRASLAVMDATELVIRRSVVSSRFGSTRRTAFIHLQVDLEQQLDAMLKSAETHISRYQADSSSRELEIELARQRRTAVLRGGGGGAATPQLARRRTLAGTTATSGSPGGATPWPSAGQNVIQSRPSLHSLQSGSYHVYHHPVPSIANYGDLQVGNSVAATYGNFNMNQQAAINYSNFVNSQHQLDQTYAMGVRAAANSASYASGHAVGGHGSYHAGNRVQGSVHGSIQGSMHGSVRGSVRSVHGSVRSVHGSLRSARGSIHNSGMSTPEPRRMRMKTPSMPTLATPAHLSRTCQREAVPRMEYYAKEQLEEGGTGELFTE
jgi:hypothetical protein